MSLRDTLSDVERYIEDNYLPNDFVEDNFTHNDDIDELVENARDESYEAGYESGYAGGVDSARPMAPEEMIDALIALGYDIEQ